MRMRGYDNNSKLAPNVPKKSYDGHVYDQYADDTVADVDKNSFSANNRVPGQRKQSSPTSKYDGIETI